MFVMEYNFSEIGERVRQYRMERDWTQDELATELVDYDIHTRRQTIAAIEHGEVVRNYFEIMIGICKAFGTDLGHMLGEYEARSQFIAEMAEYTGLSYSAIEALSIRRRSLSPLGTAALNCIFESTEFEEITERLATYLFGYSVEMIPEVLPEGAISGRDSFPVTNIMEFRNIIQPAQLIALGVCLASIEKRCTKVINNAELEKEKHKNTTDRRDKVQKRINKRNKDFK